jgi:hypothetical protein
MDKSQSFALGTRCALQRLRRRKAILANAQMTEDGLHSPGSLIRENEVRFVRIESVIKD